MRGRTTIYTKRNTRLIALFDQLLRKRPDVLDDIPDSAIVVMQIEGDEAFNTWARKIAEANARDRPFLLVQFSLKTKSRVPRADLSWKEVKLELQTTA